MAYVMLPMLVKRFDGQEVITEFPLEAIRFLAQFLTFAEMNASLRDERDQQFLACWANLVRQLDAFVSEGFHSNKN